MECMNRKSCVLKAGFFCQKVNVFGHVLILHQLSDSFGVRQLFFI